MRVLEIFPTYPGDPLDGSAVYERHLNRALLDHGTEIEVLTTRAHKLDHVRGFWIRWPDELPTQDEHDSIPVKRFHALDVDRVGGVISETVERRWSREDFREGIIVSGSTRVVDAGVQQARCRPRRFDTLADIGRGPVAPGLIAHLVSHASQFDVILAGYAPFSLPRQVLWAAHRLRTPVVLLPFIHESDRYHLFNSLLRTYERAAAVLTLSQHTSDFLRQHAPHACPVTIGAGVTATDGGELTEKEFRARHGLDQHPIVLYVGRKEKRKRYDLAVSAVEMLPDDTLLVMVGRDVHGKTIESDRVRQLGPLSSEELAAAYEACSVFVLPSEFESFGMVFLDAWLRNKPVIGNSACGASAALIDDSVDGFLCSTAEDIAVAVRRLIEDPALSAQMGAAGRAKTTTYYTWSRVAERALQVFHDVSRARS